MRYVEGKVYYASNRKEELIPLEEVINTKLADQEIIKVDQVFPSCEITVHKQMFEINIIFLIFLQFNWDEQP